MGLMKFVKYRLTFISGFVFKTFEVITELFLPVLMAKIMEQGLKNSDYNFGIKMVILIVCFAFFGYLTTLYSQYAAAKVGQEFAKELREALFNKVIDLPVEDSNTFSSSSLINRLNMDVNNLQNSLSMTIRIASRAPVLMIGSIIALFLVSPKLAIILIIGLPILISILVVIMFLSIKIFRKFQINNDRLVDVVKDNVEGSRMIRAFAQEEHEESRFKNRNDVMSEVMIKLGRITSLSSPITVVILNILLVFMIYFASFEINVGNMTDGQLLQAINYTTQLSFSIVGVMNLILMYTKAATSKTRINEVLDKDFSIIDSGNDLVLDKPMKIEFKNVSFGYGDNKNYVLNNLDFIINEGETVGIVGLTGSGKSTLVDLLMRFYDTKEGTILINDKDIKEYKIESLREKIAYAQQKAAMLQGNIIDNITMGNEMDKGLVEKSIDIANANFVYQKENGIHSLVSRGGSNFSGGQRQRVQLARALAKNGSLLILDDVFSALDYVTDLNIRTKLNKEKNNQTRIFISQRLSSIYNADKIIVIDSGKVIGIGTHHELLKNNQLYHRLYLSQVGGDN